MKKMNTYVAKLRHIAQSELHKIAARLRLMPYNDMISWALENIDIQTRSIINHQKVVVGSFRPEHLQVMYNYLPILNILTMLHLFWIFEQRECIQYDKSCPDIIKSWWGHPEKFRADAHGMYATTSLDTHMIYVAMMLCRLFRKKSPTHFRWNGYLSCTRWPRDTLLIGPKCCQITWPKELLNIKQ
jgi:hypothetical protein